MDGETFFEGPRDLLKDVQAKVLTFISRMIKKSIKLALNIINISKKPSVSSYLQDLFKTKSLQAIFECGQSNSFNKIKIIRVDAFNTREAEITLLTAIQEKLTNVLKYIAAVFGKVSNRE